MPFYDYSISVPPGRKLRMRLGRYGGLNEAFVMFLILQYEKKLESKSFYFIVSGDDEWF